MKVASSGIFLGLVTSRKANEFATRLEALINAGNVIRDFPQKDVITRVVVFSIGEATREELRREGGNPPHEVTSSHDLVRQVASSFPVYCEAYVARDFGDAGNYARAQMARGLILWDMADELTATVLEESITWIHEHKGTFAVMVGLSATA